MVRNFDKGIYLMPINTNKTRQKVLYVYATEYDVKHPTILRMAYTSGELSECEMQEILKLEDLNDYDIKPYLLSYILENYFGFQDGVYEEEYVEGYQQTRIPQNRVKECLRYVGYERTDDSWVKSGLASKEACELSKFGEILQL